MTEEEVHIVSLKPTEEEEVQDAEQIPYLQLREGLSVVSEAKQDYTDLKKEMWLQGENKEEDKKDNSAEAQYRHRILQHIAETNQGAAKVTIYTILINTQSCARLIYSYLLIVNGLSDWLLGQTLRATSQKPWLGSTNA